MSQDTFGQHLLASGMDQVSARPHVGTRRYQRWSTAGGRRGTTAGRRARTPAVPHGTGPSRRGLRALPRHSTLHVPPAPGRRPPRAGTPRPPGRRRLDPDPSGGPAQAGLRRPRLGAGPQHRAHGGLRERHPGPPGPTHRQAPAARLADRLGPGRQLRPAAPRPRPPDRPQGPVRRSGWSLGGIFARDLARRSPEAVRQVVTLGSPFRLARHSQSRATKVFDRFSHLHVEHRTLPLESENLPLLVPATSIYSHFDGIVHWQTCLDTPGERCENIAVMASHLGLGHHPAAIWAVADRLAQPEGTWKPFKAPLFLRPAFPKPATPPAAGPLAAETSAA